MSYQPYPEKWATSGPQVRCGPLTCQRARSIDTPVRPRLCTKATVAFPSAHTDCPLLEGKSPRLPAGWVSSQRPSRGHPRLRGLAPIAHELATALADLRREVRQTGLRKV